MRACGTSRAALHRGMPSAPTAGQGDGVRTMGSTSSAAGEAVNDKAQTVTKSITRSTSALSISPQDQRGCILRGILPCSSVHRGRCHGGGLFLFVIEAAMSRIQQEEDTLVSPASHRFTTGSMGPSRAVATLKALRVAPASRAGEQRERSYARAFASWKRFPSRLRSRLYFGCFDGAADLGVSRGGHRGASSRDVRCDTTWVLERRRRGALCRLGCLPVRPVTVTSVIASARRNRARLAAPASSGRARSRCLGPTLTPSGYGLR